MSRCWVRGRVTGDRCPATATHEVTAGCVHEHITVNVACARHAEEMAAGSDIYCMRCWRSPEPHRCALLARARPLVEVAS